MVPIHHRIFSDIEAKIVSGEWPPGSRIPTEQDLVLAYACSRMTVSKALSALVARGMVVRRRKTGSFVALPQIDRTVMDIQDVGTEAERAGRHHDYTILTRTIERLDASDAKLLSEPVGTEIVRLQCLHVVDGRPHALERRIIMLDTVPQARDEQFGAMPPATWLLAQVPWSKARHVIRAVSADATTARLLETARGSACLKLIRQTWQNGRTVTHVDITHPGDRFQFAGDFQPVSN